MRIGLNIGASKGYDDSLDGLVNTAKQAETQGLSNLWMAHISGLDAISALSIVGRETSTIGLGTAVTAVYQRHPIAMAQQALTAGVACGGRFSLGIGLAHKIVVESMWGYSYDKPAKYMREYLQLLVPLMNGETIQHEGEQFNVHGVTLDVPGARQVPILVAALGPLMLKLTGEMADGTVTWMTGPNTLRDYIIPRITEAATNVGKKAPAIVAGFPVALTSDPDTARDNIDKILRIYGQLPSYRAMLDKEGAKVPSEVALVGDETQLRKQIKVLRDVGVTDFTASLITTDPVEIQRTIEFLGSEV
jgi:5,10-methylenetetrahydromethanopterin reductase